MRFIGWTPTALGRLSFSRIGREGAALGASVCNYASKPEACLFAAHRKQSPDGPIPGAFLSTTRVDAAHYLTFIKVLPDQLPFQGEGAPITLREDKRGCLEGTVLVVVSDPGISPWFHEAFSAFARRCRNGDNPHRSEERMTELATDAEKQLGELWTKLTAAFASDPQTAPAFARATIKLSRTGQTTVDVDLNDLFTTLDARALKVPDAEQPADADAARRAAAEVVARQTFHFIRDLAHRHYHHDPRADLATTPFPADHDDFTWRRETQYGLVRMAIAARRENDIESYKQTLGILAYAEAFQDHLSTWSIEGQEVRDIQNYFRYDFAALRASIEASLKQLESRESRIHEARIFIFGTALTAFGLILESVHAWGNDDITHHRFSSKFDETFWTIILLIMHHPWATIIAAIGFGVVLNISNRKILRSNPQIQALIGGTSRATDAIMGEIANRTSPELAWYGGLSAVFALTAALSTLSIGLLLVAIFMSHRG